jgi:cytoskeletal protein CcmA (bactofilin family)
MAVNKNFVVKNGIEVATNLIVADPINNRVGLGTTAPEALLDVRGPVEIKDGPSQIAAVDIAGITTVREEFNVGVGGTSLTVDPTLGRVGINSATPQYTLDVRSSVSTGQTALYVFGDMRVTGDLNLDDITLDAISGSSLSISGLSTFNGNVDVNAAVDVSSHLNVTGITTLASSGGITTTGGDLYVGGNLNVIGDITYDEVRGRNINITGVTTLGTVQISSGIVTATTGVVTYFGDGSNLTGIATELVATIGISSGGTQIGSAVTMIDFAGTNAVITATPTDSGISTVTIQPSVSLGLVIALGA